MNAPYRDPIGVDSNSMEMLIGQVAADFVQRVGVSADHCQPGSRRSIEAEVSESLRDGVVCLRNRGLSDEAIREHIVRTFYTVRQRLFSRSEARPSIFWTIFEYIGGLPLIAVVVVLMIGTFFDYSSMQAGAEITNKLLGNVAQIAVAGMVALYFFLSRLDVVDGKLLLRRLLFFQTRISLSGIQSVEFQKRHLVGSRRVNIYTAGKKLQLQARTGGFHATALVLSSLPGEIVSPAVRSYLRQAWFKVPLESSSFTTFAALGLVVSNALWYLHWTDIWEGNGITWYTLGSIVISYSVLALMMSRITGSARRGVLRFVTTYWLATVLLVQGLIMGPVTWTRISLYPLSISISLPLLVLFFRERHVLILALAAVSVFAGYKANSLFRSLDEGWLFTNRGFIIELKQMPEGFAWLSASMGERTFSLGQLQNSDVIETPLGSEPWLLIPSALREIYIGYVKDAAGKTIAKVEEDGTLEPLNGVPKQWLPSRWNSELIWYDNNTCLIAAIDSESTAPAKVVSVNVATGEQNDFGGIGSCNIIRRLDEYQFVAVWCANFAPAEVKIMRYDVRSSGPQELKSMNLKTSDTVGIEHLPKSTCVLIRKPADNAGHRLSLLDLQSESEFELGVVPNNSPQAWNSEKRVFAYAVESARASMLKALDIKSGKITEKILPARTRIRDVRLSPDGTKLFYISYRPGFPYLFGRMIKGEVWDLASGKVTGAYRPGMVQGILSVIASHKIPEHAPIQWSRDSRGIIAPELDFNMPAAHSGQRYFERKLEH